MEKPKKAEITQGEKPATKDDRNPSLSYTIKSLSGNIKKLKKLKAISDEEVRILTDIHKNLVLRYIGAEMALGI